MTQQNKASLTALFEQGDIPTGTNYADFIDSCLNVAETSAQTLLSPLTVTELIASRVSATNANLTGTLTVGGIMSANSLNLTAGISAALNINTLGTLVGSAARVTGDVSADAGTVYASAVRSTNGFISPPVVVSAAGTTQGAAAILTGVVNRGKGINDGSTTGFAPLANRAGLVQYLFNEGGSANLWPPTGGFINGLAVNTPFPLAASAMVTIVHLTASAYGVK